MGFAMAVHYFDFAGIVTNSVRKTECSSKLNGLTRLYYFGWQLD